MGAITEGEWRYNQLIKLFPSEADPPFEDSEQLERWWGRKWGCTTDVGRLRVVLMHRPGDEVNVVDTSKRLDNRAFGDTQSGWYWRGVEGPDLAGMQAQHDAYTALLKKEGVDVVYLDEIGAGRMKSCYTQDSCIAIGVAQSLRGWAHALGAAEERAVSPIPRGLDVPSFARFRGRHGETEVSHG